MRIVGDIDARNATEVLVLRPPLTDVEEAAIWADGDVLGKNGRPLSGVAAEIFELLTAGEEEEPSTP